MWRTRLVGLSPQAMKTCLWTCVAYKKYAFPNEVSMDHKRTAAGEVIPGMPSDPFKNVDELVKLMQALTQNADGSMPHLFETSLMTVWDANRLPLAANLERMPEPHRSTTAAARDRSDDLYPRGLERENIGSNDGLAKIMRRFYEQRHLGNPDCTKYSAVTADVNIFDRMMKVGSVPCAITNYLLDVLRCFRRWQIVTPKRYFLVGTMAQLQACCGTSVETICQFLVCSPFPSFVPPQ